MQFGADEDAFGMDDEQAQRIAQERMARKQGPSAGDRAVGGVQGGIQGAGTGASIGTSILPGWGTAIGAIAGGVLGAGAGAFGAKDGDSDNAGQKIMGGPGVNQLVGQFGKQKPKPKLDANGQPVEADSVAFSDWDLPSNDIEFA